MKVKYGDIGYKYFKDNNGKIFALRDYWYIKKDTRMNTLSYKIVNNAVDHEWYNFNDFDYYGYGMKYMARKAEEKCKELNDRDHCVIPCTVG